MCIFFASFLQRFMSMYVCWTSKQIQKINIYKRISLIFVFFFFIALLLIRFLSLFYQRNNIASSVHKEKKKQNLFLLILLYSFLLLLLLFFLLWTPNPIFISLKSVVCYIVVHCVCAFFDDGKQKKSLRNMKYSHIVLTTRPIFVTAKANEEPK